MYFLDPLPPRRPSFLTKANSQKIAQQPIYLNKRLSSTRRLSENQTQMKNNTPTRRRRSTITRKETNLILFDQKDVDSLLATSNNEEESALIPPPSLNFKKENNEEEGEKEEAMKVNSEEEKRDEKKMEIEKEEERKEEEEIEEKGGWDWRRKKIGLAWSWMEEEALNRLKEGKSIYKEWKRKIKREVCSREFSKYFSLIDLYQMNKEIRGMANSNSNINQTNYNNTIPFNILMRPNNADKHFIMRIKRIFDFPLVIGTFLKKNSEGFR